MVIDCARSEEGVGRGKTCIKLKTPASALGWRAASPKVGSENDSGEGRPQT